MKKCIELVITMNRIKIVSNGTIYTKKMGSITQHRFPVGSNF